MTEYEPMNHQHLLINDLFIIKGLKPIEINFNNVYKSCNELVSRSYQCAGLWRMFYTSYLHMTLDPLITLDSLLVNTSKIKKINDW